MYTLYMHKNKINNKVYIGLTSRNVSQRWGKNGIKYKRQAKFYEDIEKYGWDNFEHSIIASIENEKRAEELETYLINKYNSTDERFGYNTNRSGAVNTPKEVYEYCLSDGSFVNKWINAFQIEEEIGIDAEDIRKCCEAIYRKYNNRYFTYYDYGNLLPVDILKYVNDKESVIIAQYDLLGNYVSEFDSIVDVKNKLNLNIQQVGKGVSLGYIWKPIDKETNIEYKNRLSIDELDVLLFDFTGRIPCNKYDANGKYICTFENAKIAAEDCGCSYQTIVRACNNNEHVHGCFYRFLYREIYCNDLDGNTQEIIDYKNNETTIFQYDKNGKFIRSYDSSTDACNNTGIGRDSIKTSAYNKYVSSDNYLWRWKKDGYSYGEDLSFNELYSGKIKKFINQYDLNGLFIKTHESAVSAGKEFGVNAKSISDCACGRQKSAYGYIWRKYINSNKECNLTDEEMLDYKRNNK